MRIRTACATLLCCSVACLVFVRAASGDGWEEEGFSPPGPFFMFDAAIGGVRAATAGPSFTGSRIAALPGGALVIDADSGALIATDADNKARAQLAIGSDAGLLVYDDTAKRAYVADRRGDKIVVVDVGETLTVASRWNTPVEPYGVALTPDRQTLLVTTIADRTLVAFDVATGRERWRTTLDAEPRAVAVAPDGKRAVVSSLTSGSVMQIALGETKTARRVALSNTQHAAGRVRGTFALAFVGDLTVAPFQLDVPVASELVDSGSYGGGGTPPISHHLAWIDGNGRQAAAQTNVGEPRAVAWDAARDTLYLGGLATDSIVSLTHASQVDVGLGSETPLGQRCGVDGLAMAGDGSLLVWCSFTRSVTRVTPNAKPTRKGTVARGPELIASSLDATHHAGMVLFHTANDRVSAFGQLSCGNCHLDGRADGVSWHIGKHELQTPVLAGRIAGTAPYKWDGGAADLPHSLRATIKRLGGTGLANKQLAALTAFVESIPAVRTPTRDATAVARGKQLFESSELGCTSCHSGSAYTDGSRHAFGGTKDSFDTPGLAALAASAPYFHDGSAATLEEVLRDRGRVHGMADEAKDLTPAQVHDLTAFLETL